MAPTVPTPPKRMKGATVKDVDQSYFVKAFSAFLKKSGKLKVPDFVDCVKTGKYKELAPFDPDWYYTRCASVIRHIYLRSPVGIKSLTKIYGGRQRNGVRPSHWCRSSSTVARKCLQSLEKIKLIEKHSSGGRILTSQGKRDLDRIATQMRNKTSVKLFGKKPLVISTQ